MSNGEHPLSTEYGKPLYNAKKRLKRFFLKSFWYISFMSEEDVLNEFSHRKQELIMISEKITAPIG